jgi:hypothetical protein
LPSACQRFKTATLAAEFAVELPPPEASDDNFSRDNYVLVRERGVSSIELFAMELTGDSLLALPGRPRPGPPVTIQLNFTVERGKVVTTVYTLPPESDSFRYNDGHKRRLGVHSARLNETVEVQELKRLRYQPFTFRIVSARPEHPVHSAIITKVPSIQPAWFTRTGMVTLSHCAMSHPLRLCRAQSAKAVVFHALPVHASGL